jgi:hypothetical protein
VGTERHGWFTITGSVLNGNYHGHFAICSVECLLAYAQKEHAEEQARKLRLKEQEIESRKQLKQYFEAKLGPTETFDGTYEIRVADISKGVTS